MIKVPFLKICLGLIFSLFVLNSTFAKNPLEPDVLIGSLLSDSMGNLEWDKIRSRKLAEINADYANLVQIGLTDSLQSVQTDQIFEVSADKSFLFSAIEKLASSLKVDIAINCAKTLQPAAASARTSGTSSLNEYSQILLEKPLDFEKMFGVQETGLLDSPPNYENEFSVSTRNELLSAIDNATPGSAIIVKNGTYDWGTIRWNQGIDGVKNKPIYLIPQTVGSVVFTGKSYFQFWGDHLYVGGFIFKNTAVRTTVYLLGDNIRVSSNKFESIASAKDSGFGVALQVKGSFHEIDNNLFTDTNGLSIVGAEADKDHCLTKDDSVKKVHIHHNSFVDISKLRSNGGESIMMGYGYYNQPEACDSDIVEATIEYNMFDNARGDSEVISIKSSNNIVRNNMIKDSGPSFISIRQGSKNIVTGNYVEDTSIGIRISGHKNIVVYNYFRTSLELHAGILLSNRDYLPSHGTLNTNSADYNFISRNIFESTDRYVKISDVAGEFVNSPMSNVIVENLYLGNRDPIFYSGGELVSKESFLSGNKFKDNHVFTENIDGYFIHDEPYPNILEGIVRVENDDGEEIEIMPPFWFENLELVR